MTACLRPLLFSIAATSICACAQFPDSGYPTQLRVQPLEVSELTERQRALLNIEEGLPLPKRASSDLFMTFIRHPDLFEVYDPLGYSINRSPRIPARERELLILRTAWLYQGRYEWAQHYEKARTAGMSDADIARIKLGPNAKGWSDADRTLVQAVDSLVATASIPDPVFGALSSSYDTQQIMDLITLVTHYHWVSMFTKSFGIQPPRPVPDFD